MKEVRIGIIGLGVMGTSHMRNVLLTPGAKLAAVCDVRKEVVDKLAAENKVKGFCDGEEMIKSGEIDAVIVVTPHFDHTVKAVAAFKHGVHVLTDKPIAVHKADAQRMIDAHKKRPDLKFAAMFNQRTDSLYIKIKSLIDNGELGEIHRVNWIITNWFRSQCYYNSGGWRATWKGEGGGVLLNQCPHQLDLFQWFFGMPVKLRAFCQIGRYHNIEVEDDVTAYCQYKNGSTGVFIASTGEAPGTNRLEITCDRGRLIIEDGKITFNRAEIPVSKFIKTSTTGFACPPIWNVEVPHSNERMAHQKIIANFVDAILNDAPLIAPGEEGIKSVELSNAMLYSSMKDTTVDMPLDGKAFEKLLNGLIKNSKFMKPKEQKVKNNDFSKSFGK